MFAHFFLWRAVFGSPVVYLVSLACPGVRTGTYLFIELPEVEPVVGSPLCSVSVTDLSCCRFTDILCRALYYTCGLFSKPDVFTAETSDFVMSIFMINMHPWQLVLRFPLLHSLTAVSTVIMLIYWINVDNVD